MIYYGQKKNNNKDLMALTKYDFGTIENIA